MEENICEMPLRKVLGLRMKKAWAKVAEAEKRGETVTYEQFAQFIHEACREIEEERKKCRMRQGAGL